MKWPSWTTVYTKKPEEGVSLMDIRVKPWWFRQTVADLERHEGFRQYAYPDPLSSLAKRFPAGKYKWGYEPGHQILARVGGKEIDGRPWTVGYGFTKNIGPHSIMHREVARHKLEVILLEHLYILDKLVPNWLTLPPVVRTVLANMAFNLGERRLTQFKPTLSYVARGDFKTAARRLKNTLWYKQVGPRARELVARLETLTVVPKYIIPQ